MEKCNEHDIDLYIVLKVAKKLINLMWKDNEQSPIPVFSYTVQHPSSLCDETYRPKRDDNFQQINT